MNIFHAFGLIFEAVTSIAVNFAGMINEFVGAGKDIGSVARVSANGLKVETKRNAKHNQVLNDLKFAKRELKFKKKMALEGVSFKTKAEKKIEKKLKKQQKFDAAVKAATEA